MTPDTDPLVVGLLYTGGDYAQWSWYVGRDFSYSYPKRAMALNGLDVELVRRHEAGELGRFIMGADRPLEAFVAELDDPRAIRTDVSHGRCGRRHEWRRDVCDVCGINRAQVEYEAGRG